MNWDEVPKQIALSEQDIIARLFQAGYLGVDADVVRRLAFDAPTAKSAVEQYREYNGVKGDESDLVAHLMRPRCGHPDHMARMDAGLCKWPHKDVTASHNLSGLNPLSAEVEHAVYVEALAEWNQHSGLKLKLLAWGQRTNITSEVGTTGAGILAYSYLPCGMGTGGNTPQTYNRGINWSRSLLKQVAIHEIGHALGLDHGPSGSLMQPTADGRITTLQSWDIGQIRQRYGDPAAGKDPSPLPGGAPQPPAPTPTDGPLVILPQNLVAGRYRLVLDTASARDPWEM